MTTTTTTPTPFYLGVRDGYRQGENFGSGMTWDDHDKNNQYDKGVNVGQALRVIWGAFCLEEQVTRTVWQRLLDAHIAHEGCVLSADDVRELTSHGSVWDEIKEQTCPCPPWRCDCPHTEEPPNRPVW